MYGLWHIFCYLGEEINPRPEFGGVELYTRRGGILCLVFIPLCPSYSWFSIMIILLVSSFVKMLDILLMPCLFVGKSFHVYYFNIVDSWANIHTHTLVSYWQNYTSSRLSLLSIFTIFLLKFSYTCMVRCIVVLGKNWWNTWLCFMWHVMCEGRPPKITSDTYWWWLHCGKEIYACFLSIS